MSGYLAIAGPILLGLIVLWAVVAFNRLVRDRNLMEEAWSGIDVQLKRRHDLVPSIVEVVQSYSAHERGLLEQVTRARSESRRADDIKQREATENVLSERLKTLFAVAEDYPDLKADSSYLALQRQLVEVEDQIQMARRYYNGRVRNYDIRVESFPGNIAASLFGFRRAEFFQIETATERRAPELEM
ncbi:MAG: LemA family protein [Planctomycetota bacterium]